MKPIFILEIIASLMSVLAVGLFARWAFFTHKLHDKEFYISAIIVCTAIGYLIFSKLQGKGSIGRTLQVGLIIQGIILGIIFAIVCFYAMLKAHN